MTSLTPQTAALNVGSKRTAAPDADAVGSAKRHKRADYISWDGTLPCHHIFDGCSMYFSCLFRNPSQIDGVSILIDFGIHYRSILGAKIEDFAQFWKRFGTFF